MANEIQEASGPLHGAALVTGGAIGLVAAAVWAGSFLLVLVLLFGGVLGALVAGGIALLVDRVRGRATDSGDHPVPTLSADTGPEAQRAEAGATSPSSAS